jgi:dipeptidase E
MMNLYLSSFRLGNHVADLRNLAGPDIHFALVPNALDCIEDGEARQAVVDRGISDLVDCGFKVTTFDLRAHFGSPATLGSALRGFNRVFVTGGNVFVLRRAMAYSGLDEYIWKRRTDTSFLYAAYSAGSCICAPTLDGLHLVDDANLVPTGYMPEVDYSGLSLISYSFIPHYNSSHHESVAIGRVVDFCTREKISFRAFRDGEVLVQAAQQLDPADEP